MRTLQLWVVGRPVLMEKFRAVDPILSPPTWRPVLQAMHGLMY